MAKQDPMLELSVEKLRVASMDPKIRMEYEAREKVLKDMASLRGEGKLEGKLEMAQNLLREGVDIEVIMRASGLPKAEIEQLADELKN